MTKASVIFYLTLITIALLSCSVKTKFSKTELKWLDVYNEGDVLVFRSDKGELDTTLIIKKEIYYPTRNSIEVNGKYLPQWGVVWYKNRNLNYHPEGYRLITLIKKHPRNVTFLNINYLYSDVLAPNITSGSLEGTKKGKVYEFDTYHEKATPEQPKKIFWHEDYGIIRYITHGNVVWERINLHK